MIGVPTGGKPINLSQLQDEMVVANIDCSLGLGLQADYVHTYDPEGQPSEFPSERQMTASEVITNHVAMRDRTDAELAAEFQDPATTPERKQEIRDQQAGLIPRETVEM